MHDCIDSDGHIVRLLAGQLSDWTICSSSSCCWWRNIWQKLAVFFVKFDKGLIAIVLLAW